MKPNSSILLILLLLTTLFLQTAVAQTNTPPQPDRLTTSSQAEISVIATHTDNPPKPVLAPAAIQQDNRVKTANIQVNYIDKATTWDKQPGAETAFQYAVDIWETMIKSNITIVIDAHWDPLPTNVLGSAGANDYYANSTGFPQANTWYPVSLANTLSGSDMNVSDAEINANFNSDFPDWHFGTSNSTPSDKWNFATVVLHEIGHGLGFVGSMRVSSGVGSWGGGSPYPIIYDQFTENGSGASLFSFGNNTTALGNQLISNNVYFNGPASKLANGNNAVELHAPPSWNSGSSYSHLGESFNDTEHALMTYSLTNGETNYNPGSVTLGLLDDLGWTVVNDIPPKLSQLPTQLMLTSTSRNNAFDLYDYTTPGSISIGSLTYSLTNAGSAQAGITLTNDHIINVNPTAEWSGRTTATVQVSNPSSEMDSSTLTVIVVDMIHSIFLPVILK